MNRNDSVKNLKLKTISIMSIDKNNAKINLLNFSEEKL